MKLQPAKYQCADDGTDLTALVREALEERTPASFGGRDFRVIVTCPGGAEAHQVGCTGKRL
ncbi:hypothetical protein ABT369_01870 [Dactylosporangium sp. NPDC000244]|uniref:hypothetical protein n=1 Tax=Dactylosporangium sp. NPDC000244 TaxID=3154365 RepID=UPI00332C65BD